MSYIVHYSTSTSSFEQYSDKFILDAIAELKPVQTIYEKLYVNGGLDFKKFKFFPNYKKNGGDMLGEIEVGVFPAEVKTADILENFEHTLHVDILSFLLNDAYAILLHKEKTKAIKSANSKFKNKEVRKISHIENNDLVKLW